jgi:biofilm PGA synthesis protein PgaD
MVEVPQNMHFEAPEALTPRERARDTLITAVLWGVYLYLWVPLVSLLAWALGFEFAYDVMVRAGGARDLLPILQEYAVVVSIILSAFTIWSVSNRLRFKHMTRRSRRTPVSDQSLAEYFNVSIDLIVSMRTHQILRVSFDEEGNPAIQPCGPDDTFSEFEDWSIDEDEDDSEDSDPEPLHEITATGWGRGPG